MTYSWLARCEEVVDKKLNVVILPVYVVKYWRQPFGGLDDEKVKSDYITIHLRKAHIQQELDLIWNKGTRSQNYNSVERNNGS